MLPLRRVILYSNGVAYFERRGTVSGKAEIVSLPEALDTLVNLQRQVYGEHKSWPEFHQRMAREQRVIIRITIESVGPKVRG